MLGGSGVMGSLLGFLKGLMIGGFRSGDPACGSQQAGPGHPGDGAYGQAIALAHPHRLGARRMSLVVRHVSSMTDRGTRCGYLGVKSTSSTGVSGSETREV